MRDGFGKRLACSSFAVICLIGPGSVRAQAQGTAAQANKSYASTSQRMLHALPSSTESVIVMGPYVPQTDPLPEVIAYRDGQPLWDKKLPVEREAFRCNTVMFSKEPLRNYSATHEIELSICAFRGMRTTFNIPGGTECDICQMVLFRSDVPDSIVAPFREANIRMAGFPVVLPADTNGMNEQLNLPPTLVAAPSKRLFITANSEQYLNEVLTAFANPRQSGNRFQIPARLESTRGTVWGFRRERIQKDRPAQELEIVYDAAAEVVNVRLISMDPRSPKKLEDTLSSMEVRGAQARRVDDQTVETAFRATGRDWIVVEMLLGLFVFP
jgi:hypothetical protein